MGAARDGMTWRERVAAALYAHEKRQRGLSHYPADFDRASETIRTRYLEDADVAIDALKPAIAQRVGTLEAKIAELEGKTYVE